MNRVLKRNTITAFNVQQKLREKYYNNNKEHYSDDKIYSVWFFFEIYFPIIHCSLITPLGPPLARGETGGS